MQRDDGAGRASSLALRGRAILVAHTAGGGFVTTDLETTMTGPVPQGPPDTGDHPKVALVIAAHPDDADFGAAGTAL